ncbi:hypothetical protein V1524DRAFT_260332 [Lipomyces starkeyi]
MSVLTAGQGWRDLVWARRNVALETFRHPDICARETVLRPTQSFTLVRRGDYVGGNMPPDLHEVVMGDCIPTHILSNGQIESTPVNYFRRNCFESKFRALMLQTALKHVYSKTVVQNESCCAIFFFLSFYYTSDDVFSDVSCCHNFIAAMYKT